MLNDKYLQVSIVTPDGKTYDNSKVKVLIAPAVMGQVSILPYHAPFFTKLEPGEIIVKSQKQTSVFAVFGGFMDVNIDGEVTVLADFALRSEEIDIKTAQKAKEKAEKLMQAADKKSAEYARIEIALKQALFAIKMASRERKRLSH